MEFKAKVLCEDSGKLVHHSEIFGREGEGLRANIGAVDNSLSVIDDGLDFKGGNFIFAAGDKDGLGVEATVAGESTG